MAGNKHTHAGKELDPDNPLEKPLLDAEDAIRRACSLAVSRIREKVLAHYERHPDNPWNGAALVDLEKTLKACYRELGLDVGKAFRANLPAEMQAFYDKAKEEISKDGLRNAILGKPNTRLVKNYLDSSFEQVAMRTTKMSFDHVRELRNLSADVLRTASLTGASPREVAKQMLERAQQIPGFEFIDNGGQKWKDETYFRMLARTEIMNAGRAAYDAECAEDGFDIVELDNSGESCEACEKWEGQIFSLTGATKGIPTKQDLIDDGVFHPNCTHSYSVVDDLELEERGLKVRQPKPKYEEGDEAPARQQQEGNIEIQPHVHNLERYDNDDARSLRKHHQDEIISTQWYSIHKLAEARNMKMSDYIKEANAKLQRLADEQSVFCRANGKNVRSILEDGFKTQFLTKTSNGLNDNTVRARKEFSMLGFGAEHYHGMSQIDNEQARAIVGLSPELRPIYGFLSRVEDLGGKSIETANQYGEIIFKFKDEIRDRTTFTTNDSLNGHFGCVPLTDANISTLGDRERRPTFPDILDERYKSLQDFRQLYIEAQMHGGVSADDIEKVYIPKDYSRKASVIRELKARNIPYEEI